MGNMKSKQKTLQQTKEYGANFFISYILSIDETKIILKYDVVIIHLEELIQLSSLF